MKRTVQILVVMAFIAPLVHVANAETMAERKQRIMRKYLRERQKVTQSDMVVLQTTQDQRVTDSEKFQQFKVDLARKNESASAPVPVVQQPVPVQARKSWWADDTTDTNTDPYADPFAVKSKDSKAAWWTQWKARQEEMAKQQESDMSGTYDYSGYDSTGYGYSGQQQDRGGYGYGTQSSGGYGYGAQDSNDRYGRSYYTGPNNGQLTPNGSSSYDSTPSGMLQLPYPTQTQQGSDNPARTPSSSYTPYKSRYGTQQQNQQQAAPNKQQNFNRPTPYEQWKKDNKSWDPAADDAYLDELMKKNREK